MNNKSKKLPVILSYFAQNQDQTYLNMLESEQNEVQITWEEVSDGIEDAIQIQYLPRNSAGSISDRIIRDIEAYGERIVLFQFSGHAGPNSIQLGDGDGDVKGIAGLLQIHAPNLKLVVLNGCSTHEHVETLFQKGIRAVVATHCDVRDQHAKEFAVAFHRSLSKGSSIEKAYRTAIEALRTKTLANKILTKRSEEIVLRSMLRTSGKSALAWGLFVDDKKKVDITDADWWQLDILPEQKGMPVDLAYTCDRKDFSAFFNTNYNQEIREKRKFEHYLIVGSTLFSPVGLARKLAYEKFTKKAPLNFHYSWNKLITVDVGLDSFCDLLQAICIEILPRKTISNLAMEESSDVYNDKLLMELISFLTRSDKGSIICFQIIYNCRKDKDSGFIAIQKFIRAFQQKQSLATKKIVFFWSVTYYGEKWWERLVTNYTKKITDQFTETINRSQKLDDCLVWPITKADIQLERLPKEDIAQWFQGIRTRGFLVDQRLEEESCRIINVSDVENIFLKLINDINNDLLNN